MRYRNILGIVVLVLVVVCGSVYALHTRSQATLSEAADDDTDENIEDARAYTAAASVAATSPKLKYQVSSTTPQFVLLSFDGSKSLEMLNETLDFEKKLEAKGKSLRFTYFINAAYFLTKDNAVLYQAPGEARGASKIGFSATAPDIAQRVKAFNLAFAEGNEVGSHSAGHFNGVSWSYGDWQKEFTSFATLMATVQQNNATVSIDKPIFLNRITGFRAPFLGTNDNMYKVLGDSHFTYDSSGVIYGDVWPRKDAYGVWRIPLRTVFVGTQRSPVIAMDYNLFVHQSNAKEAAVKGTRLWNTYFDQVLTAYLDDFNTSYRGNRAPIVIGEHFSKWNDGVYWEALKTFADDVCGQPQVRCVTYKEAVDWLESNGVPPAAN
jgi:hypothetical protein